jgi:hypothetical protein
MQFHSEQRTIIDSVLHRAAVLVGNQGFRVPLHWLTLAALHRGEEASAAQAARGASGHGVHPAMACRAMACIRPWRTPRNPRKEGKGRGGARGLTGDQSPEEGLVGAVVIHLFFPSRRLLSRRRLLSPSPAVASVASLSPFHDKKHEGRLVCEKTRG